MHFPVRACAGQNRCVALAFCMIHRVAKESFNLPAAKGSVKSFDSFQDMAFLTAFSNLYQIA